MATSQTSKTMKKKPKSAAQTKAAPAKKAALPAKKPARKLATQPTKKAANRPTKTKTKTQQEAPPSSSPADVRAARVEALRSVFTALGARHPDRWARSHVQDGVDQIGRFVFLRALWGRIVKDGRFLDKMRKNKSELTPVVERLLIAGAEEADVTALVRALQVGLLVDLCQLLDDPADDV